MSKSLTSPDSNSKIPVSELVCINICSWNTHGLENLLQDGDAMPFLQNLDIILAQETWSLEPRPVLGYVDYQVPAEKSSKFRRPTGDLSTFCSTKFNWVTELIDPRVNWIQVTKLEQKKDCPHSQGSADYKCIYSS